MKLLILFQGIHQVLKAEKILISHKIDVEVIPTPREFSSNCGMALRVKSDPQIIEGLLFEHNILSTIYEI